MDYYESHRHNARLTCRHFDISAQTFYRWRCRYSPRQLGTLEDAFSPPSRGASAYMEPGADGSGAGLAGAVSPLGQKPALSAAKGQAGSASAGEGRSVSTSMVGCILRRLKQRGLLVEPLRRPLSAGQRPRPRPYGVRKPKEYVASRPGDIVQVDTLDLRPLPGVVLKQFTARDMVSRWDVLAVHTRATATSASGFLHAIEQRMPFPIRAIQVDGGSEFQATFETECQRRCIRLFVLPPPPPSSTDRWSELTGPIPRSSTRS
jgi:putative transposase